MRTYFSILCIVFVLFSFVSVNVVAQEYDAVIVKEMVNDARSESRYCGGKSCPSVESLISDPRLDAIALEHAKNMAEYDRLSHVDSNGRGASERLEDAGYAWWVYAENIAEGYRDENELVEGWLQSPRHCKNIMDSDVTHFGFASFHGYACMIFVRPDLR